MSLTHFHAHADSDAASIRSLRPVRNARRYCRWFLGLTLGALAAVGTLNLLADPFWIHRGPWSSYRQPIVKQVSSRVAKGEVAARDKIDVALVGDSRTLYGLNPTHPALTQIGQPYNLGMPATTVEEATRMMELLLHQNRHQPKLILWIIQPEFLVYDRRPKYHFDYRLSRLNPEQAPASRWLHSVWSREATLRSIDILKRRWKSENAVVLGAEATEHFAPIVNLQTFDRTCQDLRKLYLQESAIPVGVEMEEPVGQVFQACAARGIQLEVIIPPSHAIYWECLDDIGWSDRVELGKRTLVQLADSACQASESPRVRVWDFSGFDGPAAETIPVEDSPIRWHADPVHFTRDLGNLIISRVTGQEIDEQDFGKVLTPENIESHLATWTMELAQFATRHQERRQFADGETSTTLR